MKKNLKSFVVYEGSCFCIEWYFSIDGKSIAQEYFEALDKERQKKIFHLFEVMGDFGKIFNKEKFRNEDDSIYAFKSKPDRFLCFFFDGAKIIITNAYEKKTEKMPRSEKERALKLKEDYLKRVKMGIYYGKKK